MTRVALLIATSAGAGYSPFASGTAGSAVGVAIYFLTRHLDPRMQIALLVVITVVGTWASSVAARHFDREDPGEVVIDEVAGQLVTYCLLGVGPLGAAIGFVLFRVLDVIKPWPARQMEHLHGGLGIMADDLMVGVYGWLILWALFAVAPGLR